MSESVLEGKTILAVDDEPDILSVLEAEISAACKTCKIDKATTYEEARKLLNANMYDIVILDIMGVRGFDLLYQAVKKGMKVAMLTAHSISLESLKRSHDMKARAYLPKDKLGEIVPFLEDVLTYEFVPGWKRLLEKLENLFTDKFGPDKVWKTWY
jgi:DNA-binding NtrC family response regulator